MDMRSKVMRWAWAGVLALSISSCAHRQSRPQVDDGQKDYVVGREDVLDVSVWRDADLSRQVPVRPDGRISMPLVGELAVAGKTTNQIADEIKVKLAPYLADPKVVVMVHEVNSQRFFVIGEVTHPGAYPMRSKTTVLQALSVAGGFNEWADKAGIVVVRDGGKQRIDVDYTDLVKEEGEDVPLRPGDTIYVP